jgi:hypothetical protein
VYSYLIEGVDADRRFEVDLTLGLVEPDDTLAEQVEALPESSFEERAQIAMAYGDIN